MRQLVLLCALVLATACTCTAVRPIPDDPSFAAGINYVDLVYEERTWISPFGQTEDPLERGLHKIPFLPARTKILGVDGTDTDYFFGVGLGKRW